MEPFSVSLSFVVLNYLSHLFKLETIPGKFMSVIIVYSCCTDVVYI